jgi:DNA-binding NarL/FixJ family response regulator
MVKRSEKKDFDPKQIYYQNQKLFEQQQRVASEITELKDQTEHYQGLIQEEFANWRLERKALEKSLQASLKQTVKTEKQPELHLNDRYKDIFDLHEQGLTVDEIARKLEKGVGEVSFILQLASK